MTPIEAEGRAADLCGQGAGLCDGYISAGEAGGEGGWLNFNKDNFWNIFTPLTYHLDSIKDIFKVYETII